MTPRMRALTIDAHGGLEQLRYRDDLAMPQLTDPDDVRVRVQAAALNRLDLWVLGGIPGVKLHPGWVLGSDGAGIVDAVGDNVRNVAIGDHVILNPGVVNRGCRCAYCADDDQPFCLSYGILGEHRPGTLAEYVVVPSVNVHTIPRHIPFETAAAFPLASLTAWRMIASRARVQPSDQVLIWGIGGGVAQAADPLDTKIRLKLIPRVPHGGVTVGDMQRPPRGDDGFGRAVTGGDHQIHIVEIKLFDGDRKQRQVLPIQPRGEGEALDPGGPDLSLIHI